MSEVRDLHKKAMALVNDANQARESENFHIAKELLKKALVIESQAAMTLFNNFKAEPTRSVLFRSAATIAYNCEEYETAERMVHCGLSSSNVPLEIKEELNKIKEELDTVIVMNDDSRNAYNYLQVLRKSAINIRLKPATPKYSEAVFIEDIMGVLRVVKNSFQCFVEESFIQQFGFEKYGDKTNKVLSRLTKDFPLLYVNSKFASFGASIATDATVITNSNYEKDIIEWKKNVFDEFKNDVIYFDYQSDKNLDTLKEKYSDEARNAIYKGIVDIFSDSKNYNVSFTDETYENTIIEGKPVPKNFKEKLLPKIEQPVEDKKLVKTIGMSQKGQIRKSDIIMSEELTFAEFKHKILSASYKNESIEFSDSIELNIIYENRTFSIDFEPFGISVMENSFEDVIIEFQRECVQEYFRVLDIKEEDHSFESRKLSDNFNALVFAST